jgi:acyl-CoA dehydrogenase
MTVLLFIIVVLGLIHFNIKALFIGLFGVFFFAYNQSVLGITISIVFTILFCIPFFRKFILSAPILVFLKKLQVLPKISETEKTALDAGTTWVEGEFFKTIPNIKKILNEPFEGLTDEEKRFMENEVEEVCKMTEDFKIFQDKDLPVEVWQYLKEKKFFGMIIPKKYGGLDFSPIAQSAIVGKLGTRSQVLSITTMVPNSLGPGELLLKYGTEKQKNYYLPRLADGREIPCFGLTEPFAGSDAASIKSYGELFKGDDGKLKIRLNFEKRYITLGGIATVIGLAFQLRDPENLLPPGKKLGITCALLKGDLEGITRGRRHLPMYVPFINSPIWGKNVVISVEDDVIGGESGLGEGWRMLMECLSVGRGISLPAIASAAGKFSTQYTLMYSFIRKQFGLPIAKFEGIEEVLARMLANCFAIDAMRIFTASAVKNGQKPAITNAIVKYHATEMARKVTIDSMDVLGGAAICVGPSNMVAHVYMGIQVGITVEGANILTRSLLHFGQGLMRCHPFLYNEMTAIQEGNLSKFDANLWGHVGSFIAKRIRFITLSFKEALNKIINIFYKQSIVCKYSQKMERISAKFGFFADLVLLMYGGGFKVKEKLSGRFGDIVSNLYIMSAILRKFKANNCKKELEPIVEYALENCLNAIDKAMLEIYANLSHNAFMNRLIKFVFLLISPSREGKALKDKISYKTVKSVVENQDIFDDIFSHVFISKDKNDRANLVKECFEEHPKAYLIIKRLKGMKKKYEVALTEGLITKEEFEFITNWEQKTSKAIQVDDFPLKSNAF